MLSDLVGVAKHPELKIVPDEPANDTDVDGTLQKLMNNDPRVTEVNLNNIKVTFQTSFSFSSSPALLGLCWNGGTSCWLRALSCCSVQARILIPSSFTRKSFVADDSAADFVLVCRSLENQYQPQETSHGERTTD